MPVWMDQTVRLSDDAQFEVNEQPDGSVEVAVTWPVEGRSAAMTMLMTREQRDTLLREIVLSRSEVAAHA